MNIDRLPKGRWIKISAFAKLVPGISMRTIRRWLENGDIEGSKRGTGHWQIDLDALRNEHAKRVDAESIAAGDMLAYEAELNQLASEE